MSKSDATKKILLAMREKDFYHSVQCCQSNFTGADAHGVVQIIAKDLTITDFTGVRRIADRINRNARPFLIGNDNFKLDLWNQVDLYGMTADIFGAALLCTAAHDLI